MKNILLKALENKVLRILKSRSKEENKFRV